MRFKVTDDISEIIKSIEHFGYAIVEDAIDAHDVRLLQKEIDVHLNNVSPDASNAFMGDHTKRFGRLLHRIQFSRLLVRHPLVLSVNDAILKPNAPTYQIHFTGVMHVTKGAAAQVLHRDTVPFISPSPTLVLATMWAVTDFTRDNGATVLVPGSHTWNNDRAPLKEELICAEMPAGSVLLYSGHVLHGAGASKSGFRTGLSLQYSVGWLRQEENQYLAVPLEEARTFSESLQKLMGYDLAAKHWGYVDQMHPLDFLNGDKAYRSIGPSSHDMVGNTNALHAHIDGVHRNHYFNVTMD